ncbi:MAG TPA: TolC family protein [Polyangia bacterium]
MSLVTGLVSSLVTGLVPGTPRAESSQPGHSLADVIQSARLNNAGLAIAAEDLRSTQGALEAAAEPFDGAFVVDLAGNRAHSFGPTGSGQPLRATSGTATMSLSQRFRNGLTIGPEVTTSTTRFETNGAEVADVTDLSARFRIVLPLLQDRGGVVVAAGEQAAAAEHLATRMEAQHAELILIARVAQAYWAFAAADRRRVVLVASEERAMRTVAETAALVKADERTGADLIQARGYESSRRTARIKAEQEVLAARLSVAALTGVGGTSPLASFSTTTPLPAVRPHMTGGDRIAAWMERAVEQRADIAAIDCRLRAAKIRLVATKSAVSARLDLSVRAGYTTQSSGIAAFDDLPARAPGVDAMVGLTYQLPLAESGARGKIAQASSAVRRLEISRAELVRRLRIDLAAAYEQLKLTARGMSESAEAVRLMERTVDSERRKFQLGSSTLFAVNQAEDSLTAALLGAIEETRAYAAAIATLRLEAGALRGSPAEIAAQLMGLE